MPLATCVQFRDCSRPTIFDVCDFGPSCMLYFLKVFDAVNPDPTKVIRFESFQHVNGNLYVSELPGLSLAETAAEFAPQQGFSGPAASLRRIEVWSHATAEEPERFKMLLAEYDAHGIIIIDTTPGALLRLLLPYREGEPIVVEPVWSMGADPGPLAADFDRDGMPDPLDNCPAAANRDQADQDGDRAGDLCDCALEDGGAYAIPGEVAAVSFTSKSRLDWSSAMPGAGVGATHDVVRGSLDFLPAGSDRTDSCLATGLHEVYLEDQAAVPAGDGFWYLVRGRNACGTGTYGFDSSGRERVVEACP
jgi:hypothetical protein